MRRHAKRAQGAGTRGVLLASAAALALISLLLATSGRPAAAARDLKQSDDLTAAIETLFSSGTSDAISALFAGASSAQSQQQAAPAAPGAFQLLSNVRGP